jgi:hypothetical protein
MLCTTHCGFWHHSVVHKSILEPSGEVYYPGLNKAMFQFEGTAADNSRS